MISTRRTFVLASLLGTGAVLSACTVAPDSESTAGAVTATSSAVDVLEMQEYQAESGPRYTWAVQSSDGFVRAGDSFTASFNSPDLVLNRVAGVVGVGAESTTVFATVAATYFSSGAVIATESHQTQAVTSYPDGIDAQTSDVTSAFRVPASADDIRLTVTIQDSADVTVHNVLTGSLLDQVRVVGGHAPDTNALFSAQTQLSGRVTETSGVLEASGPVAGAKLEITYAQARVVNRLRNLSSAIGMESITEYGGNVEQVQVGGPVDYEVWFGIDDGSGFGPETQLPATTASVVLPPFAPTPTNLGGIQAYEGALTLPESSTNAQLYFHLKAFVTATYTPNIYNPVFPSNGRYQIADAYDNPNGPDTNYSFSVQ